MRTLVIALLLIATALSAGISQANVGRLRTTPQINFTYYFQYEYPLPDVFEVALAFEKVSNNLTQTFAELQEMDSQVRAQAARWNGKVIGKDQDDCLEIAFREETNLFASLIVEIADQHSLVSFLEAVVNFKDAKVIGIEKTRSSKLNFQIEDAKAKEAAVDKSKEVCQQYFGMKYQQTLVFDKVAEGNKSEQIVAGYLQVIEKLEQSQLEGFIEQNAFFKCQIICQNQRYSSGRNKHEPSKPKKKIDIAEAEKIARANLDGKSAQKKPLQKERSGARQPKSKKIHSDQL